jgi:uncharacterized protein YciI
MIIAPRVSRLGAVLLSALLLTRPLAQEAPTEMMVYQMVFLRAGPNQLVPADTPTMKEAHRALLSKLNRERINLLYGRFAGNTDLRGLVVLDAPDAETAKAAFANDPFVNAGHLVVDVKPWYGPKGLFNPPDNPPTPERLVVGFLMRGPNSQQPESELQTIQNGHLAYMSTLQRQGKLLVAGPFQDDSVWSGIVMYRVGSVDEAKQLAAGDPAVKAGRLVIDAHPWVTFKGILK